MGKVSKIIENGISFGDAALLGLMLGDCVNIPLADLDSFVDYLELKDRLLQLRDDYSKQRIAIANSFGITEPPYDFKDHSDRPKIEEALNALSKKVIEVKGLHNIKMTPIELAKITAGLTYNEGNYIKSFLVKK